MKRLGILPIIALLFGITFSAFTNQPKQAVGQDPKWYYLGDDNDGIDVPGNYEPLTTQDSGCGETPAVVCTIQAPDASGFPDPSNAVIKTYKP